MPFEFVLPIDPTLSSDFVHEPILTKVMNLGEGVSIEERHRLAVALAKQLQHTGRPYDSIKIENGMVVPETVPAVSTTSGDIVNGCKANFIRALASDKYGEEIAAAKTVMYSNMSEHQRDWKRQEYLKQKLGYESKDLEKFNSADLIGKIQRVYKVNENQARCLFYNLFQGGVLTNSGIESVSKFANPTMSPDGVSISQDKMDDQYDISVLVNGDMIVKLPRTYKCTDLTNPLDPHPPQITITTTMTIPKDPGGKDIGAFSNVSVTFDTKVTAKDIFQLEKLKMKLNIPLTKTESMVLEFTKREADLSLTERGMLLLARKECGEKLTVIERVVSGVLNVMLQVEKTYKAKKEEVAASHVAASHVAAQSPDNPIPTHTPGSVTHNHSSAQGH